jgi:hypothetical protein
LWLASSFLRVRLGFFLFVFLSPLFFLLLVFPSLGVFSLAGSFRYFFLVLGFRRALYVAWVCFAWVYFLLEPFFLVVEPSGGLRDCPLKFECPLVVPSPWGSNPHYKKARKTRFM